MSRSDMRESASAGAIVGVWLAVVMLLLAIVIGGITWMARAGKFAQDSVFAPKEEQLRRDVFEQSKAYRDGVVQELRSMQFQYRLADAEHRAGLASVIRHKAAGVPADAIPADLQTFIATLP
jgi:uncharacterized ion transporter superfamily protein YfcC